MDKQVSVYIKKAIRNKTFVNGSLFSLFSFFGQGVSFVLLILLANYLLPEEYGSLSLFSTVVTAVGFLMAFSTRGYPAITFFKKERDEFKRDFTATNVLGVVTLCLLSLPVIICGNWLGKILDLPQRLLWYTVIISFFHFAFLMQQEYLRITEKVVRYGIYNCGLAIVNFVLTIFFVAILKQNWMGRVNAWLIATVFFGVLSFVFFLKNELVRFDFKWKHFYDALVWGVPMIPHAASNWIRQGVDRYIINYYHTTYDVGVFSFAMNLSNILIMIGTAFNSTNSVSIYQILSDANLSNIQKKIKLRKQTMLIFWLYLIATVLVVLGMTALTYFFLPKYKESIPLMWLLALSGFCNCVYFLFCNYLFYYGKTKNLMYITIGTSIAHLLMSLGFTRFSLYYTALIYGLMMALMTFLVMCQAKKLVKLYLS